MDATQDFSGLWYWFTWVKKVSGYMVVINPLRRMLTVCLRMDACPNPFECMAAVCSTFFMQLEPLNYWNPCCTFGLFRYYLLDQDLELDNYFNISAHCARAGFGGDFCFL